MHLMHKASLLSGNCILTLRTDELPMLGSYLIALVMRRQSRSGATIETYYQRLLYK